MNRWMTAAIIAAAAGVVSGCHHGPRTRADLVTPEPQCQDARFAVYFADGSARLTQPALQLLDETARRLRPCRVVRARVMGLADAKGTPDANLTLSQRRARQVMEALRSRGLPAPSFEIAAAGEAGALLPDGREDPVRRRTEVFLEVE